jgi:hypothetical protein
VSQAGFLLQGEVKSGNRFAVTTDVATGWTVTAMDSRQEDGSTEDWLTNLSGENGVVTFDVPKNEGSGECKGNSMFNSKFLHVKNSCILLNDDSFRPGVSRLVFIFNPSGYGYD